MKLRKRVSRLLAIVLMLSIVLPSNVFAYDPTQTSNNGSEDNIPVYSSIEEWQASGDTSKRVRIMNKTARWQGDYYDFVFSYKTIRKGVFMGYHPEFNQWYNVDGYFFSTTNKLSYSVTLSGEFNGVTVTVTVAKKASSGGTFLKANRENKSRPYVKADILTTYYDIYLYDEFGELQQILEDAHKEVCAVEPRIDIDEG